MRRKKLWFKVYPDDYLWGTTKDELKPDERSVWFDFLCVAAFKEGLVDITYTKSLANKLIIPLSLLTRCIKKFKEHEKIEIVENKKEKKTFAKIKKWEKYQAGYLTSLGQCIEKPKDNDATLKQGLRCDSKERRGEEIREDKIREEESKLFPSHPRDQFLYILKEFSKEYPYPFSEEADGQLFDYAIKIYRNTVDPIRETEKKIEYWKEHPGALQSKGKSPRVQLHEFFEKEAEYQGKS